MNASTLVDAKVSAGGSIYIYGKPKQINQKTVFGGKIEEVLNLLARRYPPAPRLASWLAALPVNVISPPETELTFNLSTSKATLILAPSWALTLNAVAFIVSAQEGAKINVA